MARIIALDVLDVRFPTSRSLDGSDAMNADPDYSAAYVVLRCSDDHDGHALAFTIGRGNEVVVAAVAALEGHVVGRTVDEVVGDLGGFSRSMVHDSQLRWLGPEKGVMHMAIGAVVNAAWDLAACTAGQPLWRLLSALSPRQLVDLVDWRYLTDALEPDEAVELLTRAADGRAVREADLLERGYPAYSTSAGWLGYDDDKVARLVGEAARAGFGLVKLKVGADVDDDVRRVGIARSVLGDGAKLAVDANQRWDVGQAVAWMERLRPFDPWWIEEPTSPDDVLAHRAIREAVAPIKVATGEHGANRVLFKQLLQAEAVDVVQLDATRVAGVNENIAILLLAAKFGVPVCPHAGGVGLCELVQHLAMFDYVAVSASMDDRFLEYVDHLHEHFVDPVRVEGGRYRAPTAPGFSARMHESSLARYRFPDGPEWNAGPT